jgi:hypothetical protein
MRKSATDEVSSVTPSGEGVLTLFPSNLCSLREMEISEGQYARIKDRLPVQRGNVSVSNLQLLNAVLYVAENG